MAIESLKLRGEGEQVGLGPEGAWNYQVSKAVQNKGDGGDARKDADALGIAWKRPEGDDRSAQEIIKGSSLLSNLGNQSGVKDMLKDRVGDFENDPDAAYRAEQVLNHIEKFDENGKPIAGNNVDNGRVDGFTKGGDAKHGTEAGRLQDFGKYGFSSLKGELKHPKNAANDKAARELAEQLGIQWKRPDGDDRSAQEIMKDSSLLSNLGNQSGVKDMLKDRVGDFENDPDAAFRAVQVLEHIENFTPDGMMLTGSDIDNGRIDGFTKGNEAKHGTEAGRLQDFGKYGFAALQADSKGYQDFMKKNPDADKTSLLLYKYGNIIEQNFDAIKEATGAGKYLTLDDLKKFKKDHPGLSEDFKQALDFWTQPGAFDKLDNAQNPLGGNPDGNISKADVTSWLGQAPTDAGMAIEFLSGAAQGNLTAVVDTSKLDADVFEHPENYTVEQRAAVLKELLAAQTLIVDGASAGMWKNDQSIVSIANDVRSHPDPEKLLDDVNKHIDMLQNDPEVVKYLNESSANQLRDMVENNKDLKDALTAAFNEEIKTGKGLDDLWKKKKEGENPAPQQAILAEFVQQAQAYQVALGIDDMSGLQDGIKNSSHKSELQDFYEQSLASGDRLNELLKDNSFEEATSAYSMEVAIYNSALDPEFTGKLDDKLNENFSKIVQKNILEGASFDDLKGVFGENGSDKLDEKKIEGLIQDISKEHPELLLNEDGTIATPDQVMTALRGAWDSMRQGTKIGDKLKLFDKNAPLAQAYGRGALHGASGLILAGITMANGIGNAGKLTDKQISDITTGSIQTATVLTEGGMKAYQTYLKNAAGKVEGEDATRLKKFLDKVNLSGPLDDLSKFMKESAKRFEEAAKGLGGVVGVAAGAYGIFDGVKAIRNGDTAGGAVTVTGGTLGIMAGLASAVEGGLGVFGAVVPRLIPVLAGGLGLAAAAFSLIPTLVNEIKQEARVDAFGQALSDYLTQYGIDGVENGDYWDIPEEDWPGEDTGSS